MPFLCKDATEEQLTRWFSRFIAGSSPLRQESTNDGVVLHVEGGVVVFQTTKGFYFRRQGLEDAVEAELTATHRDYLCSSFELAAGDKEPLLQRFQELYGKKAQQIDTHVFVLKGITLLLCLFPSSVVREMMCESGGMLKTVFKGNTRDLRHIPALQHFLNFPDEDKEVESVFATRYERGNYEVVRALHYQIVKEVVELKRDRGSALYLGPIGLWDA